MADASENPSEALTWSESVAEVIKPTATVQTFSRLRVTLGAGAIRSAAIPVSARLRVTIAAGRRRGASIAMFTRARLALAASRAKSASVVMSARARVTFSPDLSISIVDAQFVMKAVATCRVRLSAKHLAPSAPVEKPYDWCRMEDVGEGE